LLNTMPASLGVQACTFSDSVLLAERSNQSATVTHLL